MKKIVLDKAKWAALWTLGIHKAQPLLFPALILLFFLFSSLGEIIEEMIEGDTHEIDMAILRLIRDPNDITNPLGPHWLQEMMRDFSALGGIGILTLAAIVTASYLFIIRKSAKAWLFIVSVALGTILTNILKAGFDRPRPDLIPHDTYVYTASFPSGHSLMATIIYLTVGGFLAENEPRYRLKIFFFMVPAFMAFLVGVSRIYLGAHWASDVLAGWLAGMAWALLFWLIERSLLLRKR